jgi:hypothetical protein
MEEQIADQPRSSAEAATRALALFSVVAVALGADRLEIMGWLKQQDLWKDLAPSEAGFIDTPEPSRQQVINASWLSERLVVILWALGALDELPGPDKQRDVIAFREMLPPYGPVSGLHHVRPASAVCRVECDGARPARASLASSRCEAQGSPDRHATRSGDHSGTAPRDQLADRV